jgi:hypothetical protein
MHKKRAYNCIWYRISKAKFYLYHNTEIVKAGPGFDDRPDHPSAQINSSSVNFTYDCSNFMIGSEQFSVK